MSHSAKRSASPLPRDLDNIRRFRLSASKKDSDKNQGHATASSSDPQQGQEVISLSPFLPEATTHQNVNDLILQTAARLAREGKRLTRAPQLLPDGIAFDWVSDLTAQGESLRSLLSVQGIRSADLDKVLSRAVTHTGRASTLEPPKVEPSQNAQLRFNASAPPGSQLLPGNASNPIVIDEDDEPEIIGTSVRMPDMTLRSPHAHMTQVFASGPSSATDVSVASTSPTSPSKQQAPDIPCSPKHNVAGPSRLSSYGSGTPERSRTAERYESVASDATSLTATCDRASVVTYASPRLEHRSATVRDRDDDQTEEGYKPPHSPHHDGALALGDPSGSIRKPATPSRRQLEKRRADYGNWESLAAESSDAEMDDVHPSSRSSSPDRAFPPQSLGRIPGLGFLPQTYDASDLATQHAFAPASRSDPRSDSDPSTDGRAHTPPPPVPPYTSIRNERNRNTRHSDDVDSDPEDFDGPSNRSVAGKKSTQRMQVDSSSDHDDTDEDMRIDVTSREEAHSLRSRTHDRSHRRARVRAPVRGLQSRRNASPEPSRHSNPARRAPSRSISEDMGSDSDQDEPDSAGQENPTGHTVVIPKAGYARGRRLLAPRNQDLPLTTILMRGDAHFVDQRRKARITRWSLPVEDDSRHVEDACLIGDHTVVVGYNKGPCQVSLIPVRVDQRPRRIDLTYRAHSTVIENRFAGTSNPNPGIACLAPVGDESFLSGGHDKTVRHWKLTCEHSRNAPRPAAFSATSVRIQTQHTQTVQALAYSSWNDTVYSASGDFIAATRIDARAPAEPTRVSGKVTQVHVHPQDPHLVALEIDHMDYQVHFYDTRARGFGRKPWLEFGYRAAPPKPGSRSSRSIGGAPRPAGRSHSSMSTTSASAPASPVPKLGSRYIRGSTVHSLFARGYADGVVLVWDLRNGAQKEVVERAHFKRPAEVAHTVLAGTDVVAYGGYSATFWSTLGG